MSDQPSAIQRLFLSDPQLASLMLRIPIGIIFAAHGAQKLFAWFGGYGLEGTGQFMASQGLEPGFIMALLAGSAEFFGGLALLSSSVALVILGGGKYSLDQIIANRLA